MTLDAAVSDGIWTDIKPLKQPIRHKSGST